MLGIPIPAMARVSKSRKDNPENVVLLLVKILRPINR